MLARAGAAVGAARRLIGLVELGRRRRLKTIGRSSSERRGAPCRLRYAVDLVDQDHDGGACPPEWCGGTRCSAGSAYAQHRAVAALLKKVTIRVDAVATDEKACSCVSSVCAGSIANLEDAAQRRNEFVDRTIFASGMGKANHRRQPRTDALFLVRNIHI